MRSLAYGRPLMALLLTFVLHQAAAASTLLPTTPAERLAACALAEDADPTSAIALADSVLADPGASLFERAQALGCRGWSHAQLGKRDLARQDVEALRAKVYQLELEEPRTVLLRRAGAILHLNQDRVGAVELYIQAEAEVAELGLEAGRLPLLINLGVLHGELREDERSLASFTQALELMERLDDWRLEAPVRFNLAETLSRQERWEESIVHRRRSIELIRERGMGGPAQELTAEIGLASALVWLGRFDEAQPLLERHRDSPLLRQNPSIEAQWRHVESRRMLALGNPQAALELLAHVDRDALNDAVLGAHLSVEATALERLGRHAESVAVLRRLIEHRESFLVQQNLDRLATLDARLQDQLQRAELERLQLDAAFKEIQIAQTRRLQWMASIAAILVLLVVVAALLWQVRTNRRLDRISRTDLLTGLPNRRDMINRLREHCRKPAGSQIAVLVDIDHFKQINDMLGHDAGDVALRLCAERLAAFAAEFDGVAGRWGGEEFLLLLPGVAGAKPAGERMSKLLQAGSTGPGVGLDRQLTVSAGFASLPLSASGGDWQPSLQLADTALYVAKRGGRDAWAGFCLGQISDDWPATRLAADPGQACRAGLLEFLASREDRKTPRTGPDGPSPDQPPAVDGQPAVSARLPNSQRSP